MSNVQTIPVDSISIATRKRAISPEKVSDIRRSVKQQGLLQPIGVKVDGEGYLLIYGAHRLAAFQEDDYPEITAMVFPESMTEDECFLAEIQENLARNDLTGAERKAFAAEVGRLIAKIAENCQGEFFANGNDDDSGNWLSEMATATGTPQKTLYNWWKSFTAETDRNITPKQATPEDKTAFFDWLEKAKAKADAEKAEKERKAEEERQRKEQEAWEKRLQVEREDLVKYLDETAKFAGRGVVIEWLYAWMEAE